MNIPSVKMPSCSECGSTELGAKVPADQITDDTPVFCENNHEYGSRADYVIALTEGVNAAWQNTVEELGKTL